MKLYTYKEVAEIMKVSSWLVRQWATKGELDVIRIGHKTVRITQESLDKFLESRPGGA